MMIPPLCIHYNPQERAQWTLNAILQADPLEYLIEILTSAKDPSKDRGFDK
ncbi:MAG TPA: hypothetical protein VGK06_00890 [Methanosarcina sp.]